METGRGLPAFALPPAEAGTTCGEGGPGTVEPKGFALSPPGMIPIGLRLGTSLIEAEVFGIKRVVDMGAAAGADSVDALDDVVT